MLDDALVSALWVDIKFVAEVGASLHAAEAIDYDAFGFERGCLEVRDGCFRQQQQSRRTAVMDDAVGGERGVVFEDPWGLSVMLGSGDEGGDEPRIAPLTHSGEDDSASEIASAVVTLPYGT